MDIDSRVQAERPAAPVHRGFFADRWKVMRGWWTLHWGTVLVVLLLGVPAIDDHFDAVAPALLELFPNHGKQWVPVAGVLIGMAARVINQGFVMERLRMLFGRGGHGPE